MAGSTFIDKQHFLELLAAVRYDSQFSLLEEVVALYRGDYLEGLDYTWVIPEQEYIKQLYNKARDQLSL